MEDKEHTLEREQNAESLQRQIDEIVAGKATVPPKKSLRDFLAEKMAEDKSEEK
jgi:hypothetical protein